MRDETVWLILSAVVDQAVTKIIEESNPTLTQTPATHDALFDLWDYLGLGTDLVEHSVKRLAALTEDHPSLNALHAKVYVALKILTPIFKEVEKLVKEAADREGVDFYGKYAGTFALPSGEDRAALD